MLDHMINDSRELLSGLRHLSSMASSGFDFIPVIFVGLASETKTVPTTDQSHLWEESAYIEAQQPLIL